MKPRQTSSPLIVAHRGASSDAPENTLPSFQLAWSMGVDAVEGDFHLTKDGQVVCIHDPDTKRVAGTNTVVGDSNLAELRKLDVGSWRGQEWAGAKIPTLAEVLATVPSGKRIYLEIKGGTAMVAKMLESLGQTGLASSQLVVISFDQDVIRIVKSKAPQYKCFLLSGFKPDAAGALTPSVETILATLERINADGFSSAYDLVNEAVVQRIREAGYEYHVWTVDDPAAARKLAQWGVASITTNVPALVIATLAKT